MRIHAPSAFENSNLLFWGWLISPLGCASAEIILIIFFYSLFDYSTIKDYRDKTNPLFGHIRRVICCKIRQDWSPYVYLLGQSLLGTASTLGVTLGNIKAFLIHISYVSLSVCLALSGGIKVIFKGCLVVLEYAEPQFIKNTDAMLCGHMVLIGGLKRLFKWFEMDQGMPNPIS